jgi:hypothetical protein
MTYYFSRQAAGSRQQATSLVCEGITRNMLTRILGLAVLVQCVFGCASLQPTGSVAPDDSLQSQQISSAMAALQELDDIDLLIKLDNKQLAGQISSGLKAQAALSGKYDLKDLKVEFLKQHIALASDMEIADTEGNIISASVYGDVSLAFSGNRLEWFPRFRRLQVSSTEFTFEQQSYAEPGLELNQSLLQRLNTEISEQIMLHGNNTVPVNAVPLGRIQLGASLPGLANSQALGSEALNTAFNVNGSAILVEPSATSLALDLKYRANLSSCPAGVTVSRAGFASEIADREPRGMAGNMNDAAAVQYFYSEISGAKSPLTIIHYWFADGQALVVEELPVEPSARWRTWSSRGSSQTDASRWEVLVVEKDSGCIFHSQSIRTLRAETGTSQSAAASGIKSFSELRKDFKSRTNGFSISKEKPDIALIEISRSFLRDILQASLTGMALEADFDQTLRPQLKISALMRPFEANDIVCEHRSCPPAPTCNVSLTQCKRLRDTRDCLSCLFRNPLNNRCISEVEDPICEAARNSRNAKYEAEWTNCIADAEAARLDCDQLGAQALRSCEIESGFEQSVCESVKSELAKQNSEIPLTTSEAQAAIEGRISIVFSDISIDGDFARLRMDMALRSRMKLNGQLKFSPGNLPGSLTNCVAAWNAPFTSRAVTPQVANSMLTDLLQTGNTFTANWSGYILPVDIVPSPLESMFVDNPSLLANCSIGLSVSDVESVFTGDDADFFTGQLGLEIQPQTATIQLSPATMRYGKDEYQGQAVINATHVRYDIAD